MKGGPSWFQQHLARTVLKDYLYDICELFIDDITVFAETEDVFVENAMKILERFRLYNIKAKPSKVRLGLTSVIYISGIKPRRYPNAERNPRKVLDFPFPEYVN